MLSLPAWLSGRMFLLGSLGPMFLSGHLYLGSLCLGGLCMEGLCPVVIVQGVSVQGVSVRKVGSTHPTRMSGLL